MEVRDMINSVCGKIENSNLPKGDIMFENSVYIPAEDRNSVLSTDAFYKPIIEIERHGSYITLDLKFISAFDNDIKIIWNALNVYGSNANDVSFEKNEDNDDLRIPVFTFIIQPHEGKADYLTLSMPIMWALTSDKPGVNPHIIRVLFSVDDLYVFENDSNIRAEAMAEIKQEEAVALRNRNHYDKEAQNNK